MPLGFPVDPEVYNINSGSSESKISAGQLSLTLFNSSCHHFSFLFKVIPLFILFKTITDSTQSQSVKASFTIDFKSIVLFPLKLPSDVKTILQEASLILAAKAVDEKPANTTEWTAPILAQASTATANSGTIGK